MSVLKARILVARTHLERTAELAKLQAQPDFAEAVCTTIWHTLAALEQASLEVERRAGRTSSEA